MADKKDDKDKDQKQKPKYQIVNLRNINRDYVFGITMHLFSQAL
jgi:hypothetical protein